MARSQQQQHPRSHRPCSVLCAPPYHTRNGATPKRQTNRRYPINAMSSAYDESPPSEKYGFVLHVLCFPLATMYLVWAFSPPDLLESWNITYVPPQQWAVQIPAIFLCMFVAIPLLYAACNILFSPTIDSIYTIHDGPTTRDTKSPPPFVHDVNETHPLSRNDAALPEIQDIDVGAITRFVYNHSVE